MSTRVGLDRESLPSEPRWAAPLAWGVLLLLLAGVSASVLTFDYRSNPVAGDEASFLLQALSLAEPPHDLKFDGRDLARWTRLGWEPRPRGLIFQRSSHGIVFGKPYGYSVVLAPWIRIFGKIRGVVAANATIFLGLVGIAIVMLRRRYRGAVVPLTAGAFYLASSAYLYAYVIHTDLFVALLVASVCLLATDTGVAVNGWRPAVAAAVVAFATAEKPPLILLLGPVLVASVMETRRPRSTALLSAAVFAAAYLVSIFPYVHYSDGAAITPYTGESYYSPSGYVGPGLTQTGARLIRNHHEPKRYLLETLRHPRRWRESARSLGYYLVGAHTGIVIFQPLATLLFAAALPRAFRRPPSAALAIGIIAYVLFYVVVFPANYYGGGQSIGNRYFLQIMPAALALAVAAEIPARLLAMLAGVAAIVGTVALAPHHLSPRDAFVNLWRESAVQRLLPLERNQANVRSFIPPEARLSPTGGDGTRGGRGPAAKEAP
ncbi:MAG: hypothetical protein QOD06_951 [Candidatus Binatota bacterium]|nr:hypothetical protein [Candidatus Binatota bacterium]